MAYNNFTVVYSSELPVEVMGTKWHGAVSDLVVVVNGIFVLPQILADGG
jgi:hypothetical protein